MEGASCQKLLLRIMKKTGGKKTVFHGRKDQDHPLNSSRYKEVWMMKVPAVKNYYSWSFRGIAHTHTVYMCSSALTLSRARSALAGPRDLQGHPDTAYLISTTHCLKHGLVLAVGCSCLYSNPSFICTFCTVHGSFLCALCVASEGPLWPVEHCFVLITSHDKKDYGCVQMLMIMKKTGSMKTVFMEVSVKNTH